MERSKIKEMILKLLAAQDEHFNLLDPDVMDNPMAVIEMEKLIDIAFKYIHPKRIEEIS